MSFGLADLWFPGETARTAELDERNRELNRIKVARGQMTPEQASAQEARFEEPTLDLNTQIFDAGVEGAKEGLQAIPDTIRGGLNSVAGWTWRAIPWWVFVAGIVALLVYMGGWVRLKNILVKP